MITEQTQIITNIGTIISFIISIVVFAVKFTSLKEKLCYRIETLEDKCKVTENTIKVLEAKSNNTDLVIMRIDTKLDSMTELLLDLKKQVK